MKRPFFTLLIFIIFSVCISKICSSVLLSVAILALLFAIYYFYISKKVTLKYLLLFFIITSFFSVYTDNVLNNQYDLKEYENQKTELYVQILSSSNEKTKYTQIYAKAYGIIDGNIFTEINQKVLLYVYGDTQALSPGDKIKLTGKIVCPYAADEAGEFDYNLYLKSKRVYSIVQVSGKNIEFISTGNLFLYVNKIYELKNNIEENLRAFMPDSAVDTVKGILWGDKSTESELYEDLTVIGASHILSVSGLHVGYIYLLCIFLFKRAKLNRKLQTLFILFILFIYAAMSAFSVSVLRACIMFAVIEFSKLNKRLYDPLSSLSFAASTILLLNPIALFTASFQLSFGAVAGILFFMPMINRKINRIKLKFLRLPLQIIAITVCVQLATLPIVLYHFSRVSLIALFANVIIIPLAGIIVITAFIGMFLSFFPAMSPYFWLLTKETEALNYIADLFSKANYANITLSRMLLGEIVVFYMLLFFIFGYFDKQNKKPIYIAGILTGACIMISFIKIML